MTTAKMNSYIIDLIYADIERKEKEAEDALSAFKDAQKRSNLHELEQLLYAANQARDALADAQNVLNKILLNGLYIQATWNIEREE